MDKLPVNSDTSKRVMLGTDELTVLATSVETGGALFAAEIRMPPGGGPPVMHRHEPGEVYYVIEGEFIFYTGGFGTADSCRSGPDCGACRRNSTHHPKRIRR